MWVETLRVLWVASNCRLVSMRLSTVQIVVCMRLLVSIFREFNILVGEILLFSPIFDLEKKMLRFWFAACFVIATQENPTLFSKFVLVSP